MPLNVKIAVALREASHFVNSVHTAFDLLCGALIEQNLELCSDVLFLFTIAQFSMLFHQPVHY